MKEKYKFDCIKVKIKYKFASKSKAEDITNKFKVFEMHIARIHIVYTCKEFL